MEQDKRVENHLNSINITALVEEQVLLAEYLLRNETISWEFKTGLESVIGLTPG
jgi:hypothetical protein